MMTDMYLVVVELATASDVRLTADRLHQALRDSATESDGIQHVLVEVHADRTVISLFLQAGGRVAALNAGGQLCRRTMAAIVEAGRWTVTSTYLGL